MGRGMLDSLPFMLSPLGKVPAAGGAKGSTIDSLLANSDQRSFPCMPSSLGRVVERSE